MKLLIGTVSGQTTPSVFAVAGTRATMLVEEAGGRDLILLEFLELAGAITQPSDLHEFARTVAGRMRDLLGVCECDVFMCEGAELRYLASADASGFDDSFDEGLAASPAGTTTTPL